MRRQMRRLLGRVPKLGLGDEFILDTGFGVGKLVTIETINVRNDQSGFIVSLEASS